MRQLVSPAAHSARFASHTSNHRSPRFEPKTFPDELMPQGNLDDTPWGHSITYAPPAAINQPTPRHTMFEDSHHSPRHLGSLFWSITPAREQRVQHEPRLKCPLLTPQYLEPVACSSAPSGPALHEPKIKEPDMFSGHDPSKLYGFLAHCKMAFRLQPS
jgi:hypothetical protein